MEYLDFDVKLAPLGGRDYQVTVRSPAGEASVQMRFPFDEVALDNHLLRLQNALLRSGGEQRRVLTTEEQAVQTFGRRLFETLLAGEARSHYDQSRASADQQDKGLRLRLEVQAPELAALPWEYLYDQDEGEYVCLSRTTPIVRYLNLPRVREALPVAPPLRILGMIASPISSATPPLDVETEKTRLERGLSSLKARGLVELVWLKGQTWRDLQQIMWSGPWHIFHFIGHGGFNEQAEEGTLALADDDGRLHLLSAPHLGRVLADHRPLRLVVLNACEGAKAGKRDLFSSVGATLARRGIPAVLAMQYEITDRAAIELTRTFYEALARGLPVDTAVTEARIAINVGINNSLEWGTPVLYLRTPTGVLFDLPMLPLAASQQPAVQEAVAMPLPLETANDRLAVGQVPQQIRKHEPGQPWDEESLFARLAEFCSPEGVQAAWRLYTFAKERGARFVWRSGSYASITPQFLIGGKEVGVLTIEEWPKRTGKFVINFESLAGNGVSLQVLSRLAETLRAIPGVKERYVGLEEKQFKIRPSLSIDQILARPGVVEQVQDALLQLGI